MAKKRINRAEELTYKALQKAVQEDKVQVCLLTSQINRPTSPVYNPWEVLLPVLVPVLIGLILIMAVGPLVGLLLMIALILVGTHFVKKKLETRLLERTKKRLIDNLESCEEIWNFGGVVLVNKDNKNIGCIAPDGDWKEFVVQNFADLMVEKKEQEKEQTDEKA